MDVAVVVNLRARRASATLGRLIAERLPRARVAVTSSVDDLRRFIDRELVAAPPELLLSGGGDGTAVTVLNELRDRDVRFGQLGVLRLGTGNGWANATGAPRARRAIADVAAHDDRRAERMPSRRFALVESDGRVAPFLGTGWDAEIITDFRTHVARLPAGLRSMNQGLAGYLAGMFTRTIPRHVFGDGPPHVVLTNLGEPALTLDDAGRVVPVPGGERGAVLYRGPASVAAAGTTEEWGFGFRAFPFAHSVPGRVNARIYGGPVLEATRQMFRLWRGDHPIPRMHDFFVTHARMEFDREVPFQIGGDVGDARRAFDVRLAREAVDLVDWSRARA